MAVEGILRAKIPVSTYRLQFSNQFRFSDARDIVRYIHDLGISDIYASPYLKAKEGSLHGYDIVDHNTLNPEIGTEEEYKGLIDELEKYGMGQILDIVPNHMCITSRENVWWMDILENGPSSSYAKFFDIDWNPVKEELKNNVLLPVLGDQYGRVLENQELRLFFEEGAFFIYYYEHKFPIRPQTYVSILEHNIEGLRNMIGVDNAYFVELLSIITAIGHLPPYTEISLEKLEERHREKNIIKKRLWNLYNERLEIKKFLDENVNIFNGIKGDPGSFDLLDKLLSKQVYRLSYWRVAVEEINYRRFFDINDLAAIRMENPIVFKKTHELILELIKKKCVSGLRVDHPDGLYSPSEYFHRLQRNCYLYMRLGYLDVVRNDVSSIIYEGLKKDSPLSSERSDIESEILEQYDQMLSAEPLSKPFYIVGEKILTRGERMPEDWPIFSTTGYVFLNSLNGIFVETANSKVFDDIYYRFIRSKINYQDIVYKKKKLIMQVAMASEINTLGRYLNRISEKNRHTRDFTLNSLTAAIIEVIAFFPVYRTYINSFEVNDRDKKYIEVAVSRAKRKNPAISESVFNFLNDVITLACPAYFKEDDKTEWLDFTMKFQQITGPVMAKGVEDTAFYIYNRLISLNEVGGIPERFGTPLETFHGQNIERTKFWPHALIATSTHDSKRSEDVRARINVLSEIPDEWKECLKKWHRLNKNKKPKIDGILVPDRNEEYFLYQTLIGVCPIEPMDQTGHEIFKERIKDHMLKALREAKINTSWINPNTIYEDALMIFIENIMDSSGDNQFLKSFVSFQKKISNYGIYNSLSQTLLKMTSPGIPDFYQGTEIWDFSLVDPDNRRPVDYGVRINMIEELKRRETEFTSTEIARDLTVNKENGMIKLYLMYKTLNYRKENRGLFEGGEYIPLNALGVSAENICAFARRSENLSIIVIVPKFLIKLMLEPNTLPFGSETWGNSYVIVPYSDAGIRYRNVFTGETLSIKRQNEANVLYLSEIFANFPVALLERINDCVAS